MGFPRAELSRRHGGDGGLNESGRSLDSPQLVRGKLEDADAPSGEVLLVAKVLVRCDKQVEFGLGQPQKLAVLDAAPATFLGRRAGVSGEQFVQGPGHTLVQQNVHAASSASSVDSDRSKTRHAISRETVGKQSRNSSSE